MSKDPTSKALADINDHFRDLRERRERGEIQCRLCLSFVVHDPRCRHAKGFDWPVTADQAEANNADDPDWLNPAKGGNRGADDYW